MSPIIDLQRRLVEVGRIRMGKKGDKGQPQKLATWRLTTRDKPRLDAAAELYGGTVVPWAERDGEYELICETDELAILVLPGQALSQWYELWSGGGCQRRCDSEREIITDSACICDSEDGERKCKPTTRLSVMLPDIPGLGTWRLETHGYYAAIELSATASMLEQATARGQLIPARLCIDQRSQVKDGQTKRFAVPVIDLDITARQALGAGFGDAAQRLEEYKPTPTPIRQQLTPGGVTLEEGLKAAASLEPRPRGARAAAPIPIVDDDTSFGPPVPVSSEDGAVVVDDGTITDAQKKKLNVLVGKLRDANKITTDEVYQAAGRSYEIHEVPDLHWSTLRETLTKDEASDLITKLEMFEMPAVDTVEPLTVRQLNSRIRRTEIDPTVVAGVGRRLYPNAKGASSLSDEERGVIWLAVQEELASV